MLLPRFLSTVICTVFIATGAVSGEGVLKAVGDQVSFRPDKFNPPVTSIIWKHRNISEIVVKAIEWEKGETEVLIPNSRFKDITTVNENNGEITIKNLNFKHSGVYTIDINSKEQEQRFKLTVMERVPKPVIKIEPSDNPDVVYLRCEYSEPIIWKNSDEETLKGSTITPKGQSITVKKNGKPETFYTCTLDNGASKETSDPVYESDLFKDGPKSGSGLIVGIVILIIIMIIVGAFIFLYKRNENFKERVDDCFPCFGGPKDKDAELKGVKTNSEHKHLKEDEGQPEENNDAKEGVQPNPPTETPKSNDNTVKRDDANSAIMAPETDKENENK